MLSALDIGGDSGHGRGGEAWAYTEHSDHEATPLKWEWTYVENVDSASRAGVQSTA